MGAEIRLSARARADLTALALYIAHDNPERADSFVAELISKTEILATHPLLGPVLRGQDDPAIREFVYGASRIIYRYAGHGGPLRIVRFWHGARGTPRLRED